jgi:hypothetical protein
LFRAAVDASRKRNGQSQGGARSEPLMELDENSVDAIQPPLGSILEHLALGPLNVHLQ